MKVGVYGGTFDPVHTAHLIVAEHTREQLNLDLVLFVPSYIPPHKKEAPLCRAGERLEMVKLAVKDNPHFQAIDFEVRQKTTSFSIDTLQHIRRVFSLARHELFLLIGADNYKTFDQWKAPQDIYSICRLAVAGRPDADANVKHEYTDVERIDAPLMQISSTAVRERYSKGKSIRYMVPRQVEQYIRQYNIYQ